MPKSLLAFRWFFGRFKDTKRAFWNYGTFSAGLVARAAFVAITFIMGDLWCTRTISLHLSRRGFFFSLLTILFFSSYLYLSLLLSLSSCCVPWWGLTHTHLVSHTLGFCGEICLNPFFSTRNKWWSNERISLSHIDEVLFRKYLL